MGASYQVRGDVAVITLDNPPVNGLGYDTRREFAAGIERAAADKAIAATAFGEPNSLMSAPPEKARPPPVITMALTAASASARSTPAANSTRVS